MKRRRTPGAPRQSQRGRSTRFLMWLLALLIVLVAVEFLALTQFGRVGLPPVAGANANP